MNKNQLTLFVPAVDFLQDGYSSERKIKAKRQHINWIEPHKLFDHPVYHELFGSQRPSEIEDLLVSLKDGFDASRPIKAVKRNDSSFVIIDGHRRKYGAICLGFATVPVVIDTFASEIEEREEIVLANVVRNQAYKSLGICKAVWLMQQIRPYKVKQGRPRKKNDGLKAFISDNSTGSTTKNPPGSRRFFYAEALGVSEKKVRMADYVLRFGTKEEQIEFDFGPRKPTQVYDAVCSRIAGRNARAVDDLKSTVRLARTAIHSTTALLLSAVHRPEINTTTVDTAIKSLSSLAKQEVSGQVPRGSVTTEAIKVLARLLDGRVEL